MEISKFIEEIKKMSVLELNELVKAIETEFGVSAAAPVASAGPAVAAAAVEEEKTEFDVVLKSFGANKVAVIKVVRELTGLGLIESKNLVESCATAPAAVKEAQPKEEATKMVEKLKEAGAEAEIK